MLRCHIESSRSVRSVEPLCSIRDDLAYVDSHGRIAGANRVSAQRGARRCCLC